MSEPKAPGVLAILAFVDWCREAERLAFQLGVGPMPVENFGEPSWLRDLRARQKEAAK